MSGTLAYKIWRLSNRNKTWKRFLSERQTFVDSLQSTVEEDPIVDENGCVMIHPILATRLRAWCSVEYEVSLYAQIFRENITDLVSHPMILSSKLGIRRGDSTESKASCLRLLWLRTGGIGIDNHLPWKIERTSRSSSFDIHMSIR
jgi:hypothetical protein